MRCFGKIVHQANLLRNIGMLEDSLLGIRYVNNLALQLGGPYTIRYKNRFCTGNIFVGKVIGTRGWKIPVNGTGLEQGAASGWETDRMNLATGPLVNLFAEDLTVYPNGEQGAQIVYYEQSLGKWN